MGIFEGNFSSKRKENHVFLCDHPIAQSMSIYSTTTSSFSEIYNKSIKGIKIAYPNAPNRVVKSYTILDLFRATEGVYEYFDGVKKRWQKQTVNIDDARWLIDFYEKYKRGEIILTKENLAQYPQAEHIKNINASIQKSLFFYKKISEIGWLGINDDKNILVKLFFRSNKKYKNNREVVNKGEPKFAVTQRRSTGAQTSFRQNQNFQSESSTNIATYFPPHTGGDENLENVVAAPLDMTYNHNTGRLEAGNRVLLAKVVGDILPAEVDRSIIDDSPYTTMDFYDITGSNYTGQFSTGEAVVLTVENSDPNLFGPNFISCSGATKLEKILVTNRTNNFFKNGDMIKCTNIDGFWIPEPFAGEVQPKPPSFGEWSFSKMIANTDTYFKDNRYYSDGDPPKTFKHSDYEVEARKRFYFNQFWSDLNPAYKDIIKNNASWSNTEGFSPIDFIPSKRYYISSVYDQLPVDNGGWSDVSVISKTNMKLAEKGDSVLFESDCPFFWGPLFSDGYYSLTFNTGIFDNASFKAYGYINNPENIKSTGLPLNGDVKDINHLPAETVGNILDFRDIIYNYEDLGKTSGIPINKYHNPTFYGSEIVSKNKLQFVPMTAEFAGHNDRWATENILLQYKNQRDFYISVREFFSQFYGIAVTDKYYFGNMFDRVGERQTYTPIVTKVNDQCAIYDKDVIANLGVEGVNVNTVAYDCFIRQKPTSVPIGAPVYFQDTGDYLGANCVGIISAKNTFSKRGGGIVNLAVSHVNIGLATYKQATGGVTNDTVLFWDNFTNYFLGVNSKPWATNRGNPQWGSTTDDINSFGTTALHARVFDAWPSGQTIFDPRYFSVLHFNPGLLGSTDGDSTVDFKEPYAVLQQPDQSPVILELGSTIVNNELGKIQLQKNTCRRGQLISANGFKYNKKTFGLYANTSITYKLDNDNSDFGGTKFKKGNVIECINGVLIEVMGVDENGTIVSFRVRKIGEDFSLPNSFPIAIVVRSPEGGLSARINFNGYQVVKVEKTDLPPKEHTSGPTRLTYSTNGVGYISGTKETQINLESNDSGQYDLFLHFHNDITHTHMFEYSTYQTVGFGQYLDMTIT